MTDDTVAANLPLDQAPTRHIVTLQALRGAPTRAAEMLAALPEEAYHWQPSSQAWCMRQIVAHLAAGDSPFLARLQRMLSEHNPFLPYFGPDVARPDSPEPMPALLASFRAERDRVLRFLSELAPDDWERPGVHETMGPTTLALQVQNIAHHDAEHLGELHALGQAWAQRRPGDRHA